MLDLATDEFVHFLPQRGITGRDQRQSAIPWWTVQKSQTCFVPFQICDARWHKIRKVIEVSWPLPERFGPLLQNLTSVVKTSAKANKMEIRMDLQHTIDRVSAEISEVGALIRSLAGRYEGVFALLGSELGMTLGRSETMADAARHAIAFADAAAATFRESHPNQPIYDCKSGCSACCHLYVAVPPGVAAVIAEHIEKTFTPIEREKLRARLVEAAAAANAAENPTRLRLRCPLLDEGDRCSVYDVRPLSCRAFTSTSVSRCRQIVSDKESQAGGVDQNPAHFRIHMVATLALEQAARSRGLPAQQKGLAQAVLDELTVIPSSATGSV